MRTATVWADQIPERDKVPNVIWSIAFKPDGTQCVVAAGNRVLVYDTTDGDLLHSLKAHREAVYCVAYSKHGKKFASGGADKQVIIWTDKAEGKLKYNHGDSVQCLAYNPVTQQLASGTASDFGLWSPEQKSVTKHRVNSKVISMAWTTDGLHLALGQFNGHISIRDKFGNEKTEIVRNAPVWTLAWNPMAPKQDPSDVLLVGCWDQTLSFYKVSGQECMKEQKLTYDPLCVSFFSSGDFFVVSGTDNKLSLYSREGVFLGVVGEMSDWVWACAVRPRQHNICCGSNQGHVSFVQVIFSTVHGLYQDRYAYRELMTDVIVQHLVSEQKVRIRCKDYVKKIAVYRDRLAVQLSDKVLIYEVQSSDPLDMHYKNIEKIRQKFECSLLVVTSHHIILCQEKTLQLYSFKGVLERVWILESLIRYIKVVGGPPKREGLLVGLKNGHILKVFIDNPFPVTLIKQHTAVRCLDLSMNRKKLAVVDEAANMIVYDLETQQQLMSEPNANSVAWNSEMEDMLAYSGNGQLSIKTGSFPPHTQKLQGFVVGFTGSKIFCLHFISMQTIDVPQSVSLSRYVEKRDLHTAYKVGCLGVTDTDWRNFAIACLMRLELDIARRGFIRIRDIRYIDLLARIRLFISTKTKGGSTITPEDRALILAQVLAFQSRFAEAEEMFLKAGQPQMAVEMYTDLHLWDEAKRLAALAEKLSAQGALGGGIPDSLVSANLGGEVGGDLEGGAAGGLGGGDLGLGGLGGVAVGASAVAAAGVGGAALGGVGGAGEDGEKGGADVDSAVMGLGAGAVIRDRLNRQNLGAGGAANSGAIAARIFYSRMVDPLQAGEEGRGPGGAGGVQQRLILLQAAAAEEDGDLRAAGEMYVKSGQLKKALDIFCKIQALDALIEVVRQLRREDKEELHKALAVFRVCNHFPFARETILKLGEVRLLVKLHVDAQRWEEAFQICETHPELGELVYIPWAEWLCLHDRFEEARAAFQKAGRRDLALLMLLKLTNNAVRERRYRDAAVLHWHLAVEALQSLRPKATEAEKKHAVNLFWQCRLRSEIFFAYSFVYCFVTEPFTTLNADFVANAALFLWNTQASPQLAPVGKPLCVERDSEGRIGNRKFAHAYEDQEAIPEARHIHLSGPPSSYGYEHAHATVFAASAPPSGFEMKSVPPGVSRLYILYALARRAPGLGAHKLARQSYERLQTLTIPPSWRNQVDAAALTARGMPFTDGEELLAVCARCMSAVPLLRANADSCSTCFHPLIRSFLGFDVLPLVEFEVDPVISPEEARRLIEEEPPRGRGGWKQQQGGEGDVDTLRFEAGLDDDSDPLVQRMVEQANLTSSGEGYQPFVVDREMLRQLDPDQIFIVEFSKISPLLKDLYFRNMLPEVEIVLCPACGHFFHAGALESHWLQSPACPLCKSQDIEP